MIISLCLIFAPQKPVDEENERKKNLQQKSHFKMKQVFFADDFDD